MQSHFFKMFETILAKDIDAFESYMHPEFISVSEFEMSTREDFLTQMKEWFDDETFDLERIEGLSDRQHKLLENSLERLFARKSHWKITDKEILGQYEIVTEYMSPRSIETYVDAFKKREKLH